MESHLSLPSTARDANYRALSFQFNNVKSELYQSRKAAGCSLGCTSKRFISGAGKDSYTVVSTNLTFSAHVYDSLFQWPRPTIPGELLGDEISGRDNCVAYILYSFRQNFLEHTIIVTVHLRHGPTSDWSKRVKHRIWHAAGLCFHSTVLICL